MNSQESDERTARLNKFLRSSNNLARGVRELTEMIAKVAIAIADETDHLPGEDVIIICELNIPGTRAKCGLIGGHEPPCISKTLLREAQKRVIQEQESHRSIPLTIGDTDLQLVEETIATADNIGIEGFHTTNAPMKKERKSAK